jgi:hypothetical protein
MALHTLTGHRSDVRAVAVTADGTLAITGSWDGPWRATCLPGRHDTGRDAKCGWPNVRSDLMRLTSSHRLAKQGQQPLHWFKT